MNNEQLKQEAIKKAYGEYYEQAKPSENGWCRFGNITHKIFKELDMVGFSSFDSNTVRPKSLAGIKTNNGWIRIEEDGSNLENYYPSEVWIKHNDGDILTIFATRNYLINNCSHYQPIIKPQIPIY